MFFKRHYEAELIDNFSIRDTRIDAALKELIKVNKYLGGDNVSMHGIQYFLGKNSFKNIPEILDVGAGGSDFFYKLKLGGKNIKWTNIDLNIQACRFDNSRGFGNSTVCCNALKIPFKDRTFDIVHASLFLHHFKEEDILQLLEIFSCISRKGIVINDLRRNAAAYLGIKLLTLIFSRSELVKNDGPLSVKRGFVKEELVSLLHQAGYNEYIIKRKWAFRWSIIIPAKREK